MNFRELALEDRLALKERAKSRTLTEMWRDLPPSSTDDWSPRTRLAAEMLTGVDTVADIGCGSMELERLLPNAVYWPIDCVARDPRTIVVDLNKEPPPQVSARTVTLLGVLEYIIDAPKLLRSLAALYPQLLISYNIAERRCEADQEWYVWVNDYSRADLEDLFSKCGYSIEKTCDLGPQVLWLLKSDRCYGPASRHDPS